MCIEVTDMTGCSDVGIGTVTLISQWAILFLDNSSVDGSIDQFNGHVRDKFYRKNYSGRYSSSANQYFSVKSCPFLSTCQTAYEYLFCFAMNADVSESNWSENFPFPVILLIRKTFPLKKIMVQRNNVWDHSNLRFKKYSFQRGASKEVILLIMAIGKTFPTNQIS